MNQEFKTKIKNVVIAKYIGLVFNGFYWADKEDVESSNDCPPIFYSSNDLKYHSSWDWLMPVITKLFKDLVGNAEDKTFLYEGRIREGLQTQNIQLAFENCYKLILYLNYNQYTTKF